MNTPFSVTLTPPVLTSPYSANTVIGGLLNLGSMPGIGLVRDVVAYIDGVITPALDLYLFADRPAFIADAAPFAPTYADQVLILSRDKISIVSGDYITLNSKTRAPKKDVNADYDLLGRSSVGLYLFVVAPNGVTFGSTSALTLKFGFWAG